MTATSPATIVTFLAYIAGVFVLAGLSHKLLSKKSFMGEYFLGSRGLGSWALAFTFAATSASGGSFTGYPALIYSYGWVLAFWIASYMVMPLCTMGVMGKRLNQIARMTGAITIPDVLRDRFESSFLGLFATCTIIFFTVANLVAQFKAGAIIIEETFNLRSLIGETFNSPNASYIVGLLVFAGTVVFYTAYGGFRAVVWTDVMQGIVMGLGVVILVPLVIHQAGGLNKVNDYHKADPPTVVTSFAGTFNDIAIQKTGDLSIEELVFRHPRQPGRQLQLAIDPTSVTILLATNSSNETISTANDVKAALEANPDLGELNILYAFDNERFKANENGETVSWGADGLISIPAENPEVVYVFRAGAEALVGPGKKQDGSPFHPIGMGISFFFMWAISGMGQPGTMVRLMAFKDSKTLKRAILTVSVYYTLIYLPMVFLFVSARTLIPHLPQESHDKAMVLVATRVVSEMGLGYQILAAIFVAAPFAAVMSTVDSFLLMISSSLVRDIYQRTINPKISEKAVKWACYGTTVLMGTVVTILALRPPDFLQFIIVFTGGGFASTFLFPTLLGIYWKGMTRQAAIASMVGGFLTIVGLFLPRAWGGDRINLFGFHPIFWGLTTSFLLAVVVSKLTGPAPAHLVKKYFYRA